MFLHCPARSRNECYRFLLPVGYFGGNCRSQAVDSNLAAPQGFEPRYADPESAVLPLNEGAVIAASQKNTGSVDSMMLGEAGQIQTIIQSTTQFSLPVAG